MLVELETDKEVEDNSKCVQSIEMEEEEGDDQQSVPNDNYIMDKFLKQSDNLTEKKKKKIGSSPNAAAGMGSVLQRSISLKSLRGNQVSSHAGGHQFPNPRQHHLSNGRLDLNDEDDTFSVLSLDRKTYDNQKRKSHHTSEVQLSAHVLAQFEAKSLLADLKRDSFRARNGTTNFALNPIFDEVIFSQGEQVPNEATTSTFTNEISSSSSTTVNYNLAKDEETKVEIMVAKESRDQDENNNNLVSFTESTNFYHKLSSEDKEARDERQEGRNNCVETSFESLDSIKRRSIKLQAKDFGDDLY